MELLLNVGLVLFGFVGSIIAIGGDTWRHGHEFVVRRILLRGWIAMACLIATLALGVTKEILTDRKQKQQELAASDREQKLRQEAEKKDREAAEREAALQKERQEAVEHLFTANQKLDEAKRQLISIEPTILSAMTTLTARIPRESDFAFAELRGAERVQPRSSETGRGLEVYGGDEVELHVLGRFGLLRLVAGERKYPISRPNDTIRVSGPIGQPLPAFIENPTRITDVDIKIIIRSTDRTRFNSEFGDILGAIRKAKSDVRDEAERSSDAKKP